MGVEMLVGMAAASLVGSLASGVMGAQGASTKAAAEQDAYNYKAQVANNNAIIAKRNAEQAEAAGRVSAQANDLKSKNLVSTQLVTQASLGLDVGSGSAVEVRQSAADIGHLDTMTILNNAAKNAAGFKAQGMNFTAEGTLNKKAGAYAQEAGEINVASSLLGGATSFADKWIGYSSKGVFS